MTCACARASKKETHFRSTGCIRSYWHSVCKRHAVHHFSHPAKSKVLISFVHVTKSGNVTCGHQKLPKFWAIFPHWDNYSFQKNNHCIRTHQITCVSLTVRTFTHHQAKGRLSKWGLSERAGLWGPALQLTTTHGFNGTNFCEFYALFKAVALCWVGGRVQHVTPLVQKFSSWRINDTFRDASVRSRWGIDTSAKRDVCGQRSL
jgi:hypothetical protein